MSINKVILVGNVGKDPVVRYFDKGVAKATFPLATSETYTNQQGETITSTEWHNIVLWRALAEVAEKTVKKGAQVYIVGKMKTRSYIDKDGNNKYITEILGDTMILLEKKTGSPVTNQPHVSESVESAGLKTKSGAGKEGNNSSNESTDMDYNSPGGSVNHGGKQDNSFDEENPGGKNEDDLPF
ncbi:MAG: single-stranded DNA-binding protein [Odoribacter sp.]|nr:single-stranded DNA-binding protein [Odoribacter sp.]